MTMDELQEKREHSICVDDREHSICVDDDRRLRMLKKPNLGPLQEAERQLGTELTM